MNPWMNKFEIKMIKEYIKPNGIMLEWGSGGSTFEFPKLVKEYYSIEHDEGWYNKISTHSNFPKNVKYFHVPSDLPRSHPVKPEEMVTYINYPSIFNKRFDNVLVDGRARLWCAENILPYLHEDSIVFIHDFWPRKHYHGVFEWYDVVDKIELKPSLVVLKKK